jgi:deazaflavin-dependent oxidoreductase (nitroreductase family)
LRDDHINNQYLYLTTKGRRTGLPREIEIWFVSNNDKLYILAEHFLRAQWVINIQKDPTVEVRLGTKLYAGSARVLDPDRDRSDWNRAQELSREKYGWGDGLPVELSLDQFP